MLHWCRTVLAVGVAVCLGTLAAKWIWWTFVLGTMP